MRWGEEDAVRWCGSGTGRWHCWPDAARLDEDREDAVAGPYGEGLLLERDDGKMGLGSCASGVGIALPDLRVGMGSGVEGAAAGSDGSCWAVGDGFEMNGQQSSVVMIGLARRGREGAALTGSAVDGGGFAVEDVCRWICCEGGVFAEKPIAGSHGCRLEEDDGAPNPVLRRCAEVCVHAL
ncbi:hypothetical protein ACLOJK_016126 [Asimina triloba]